MYVYCIYINYIVKEQDFVKMEAIQCMEQKRNVRILQCPIKG